MPLRVDESGIAGPTPREARGPRWRRVAPGWVVHVAADAAHPPQRILESSCRLPPGGAITGWAALHWLGCGWLDGSAYDGSVLPVPVVTGGRGWRPRPGVSVSQEFIAPCDVLVVDGVPVARPALAAVFEARHATELRAAVVALDATLASDLVSLAELRLVLSAEWPRKGIEQARGAVALAVENSWSPAETRARLLWELDADLPRPWCNVPVFDLAGSLVGIPDLLDCEAGQAVEYEGAVHLDRQRRRADVRRERGFRAVSLPSVTLVGEDLLRRASTAQLLRSSRAAAAADTGQRLWTTDPPAWWIRTDTVERRRSLSPGERARALLPPGPAPAG